MFVIGQMLHPFYVNTLLNLGLTYQADDQLHISLIANVRAN